MSRDYLKSIETLVEGTPNTSEGIARFIQSAQAVLATIDVDLDELVEQRAKVRDYAEKFLGLQKLITGYQSASASSLDRPSATGRLKPADARNLIMRLADEAVDTNDAPENRVVRDQTVLEEVSKAYDGEDVLPWSNPKAVISTVLSRNENWERVSAGAYKYVGDISRLEVEELPW